MKAEALLLLTRSFFINLTHIGIFPDSIPLSSSVTYGGDLFFSGHTAFCVLSALIFWEKPILRYSFFTLAVVLGLGAILGHYHYSIDVFSAPFFAYGIYIISKKFFRGDFNTLEKGLVIK
jgi:membrane-associated phospholipid phosphatase